MKDGAALNINTKFEVIYCYKCRIPFAVPAQIRRKWLDSGDSFYCPNGHSQAYVESNVEKLTKQLDLERKRREWSDQAYRNASARADDAERRERGQRAAKTRLRNRIKAGLCPCCNRHFKQLAAHMANKHPDFQPEAG